MTETLGQRIRRIRRERKLSLSEMSRLTGVSKGFLSQVETGKSDRPSVDTFAAIATELEVSMDYLYWGAAVSEHPEWVGDRCPSCGAEPEGFHYRRCGRQAAALKLMVETFEPDSRPAFAEHRIALETARAALGEAAK